MDYPDELTIKMALARLARTVQAPSVEEMEQRKAFAHEQSQRWIAGFLARKREGIGGA